MNVNAPEFRPSRKPRSGKLMLVMTMYQEGSMQGAEVTKEVVSFGLSEGKGPSSISQSG